MTAEDGAAEIGRTLISRTFKARGVAKCAMGPFIQGEEQMLH